MVIVNFVTYIEKFGGHGGVLQDIITSTVIIVGVF